MPPAGAPPRHRPFITALGIGQICSWGSLFYSFPLMAQMMGPELGWSKSEIYLAVHIKMFYLNLLRQ